MGVGRGGDEGRREYREKLALGTLGVKGGQSERRVWCREKQRSGGKVLEEGVGQFRESRLCEKYREMKYRKGWGMGRSRSLGGAGS